GGGEPGNLLHVGAHDERVGTGAAHHQTLGRILPGLQLGENALEAPHHRCIQDVEPILPAIEDEMGDALGIDAQLEARLPLIHAAFSMRIAAPCPPPTHRVARPSSLPRRLISRHKVSTSRAPVQPTGWPRAMAPPFTLVTLRSISPMGWDHPSSRAANSRAAKASLISTSFTSRNSTPPRFSASGVA